MATSGLSYDNRSSPSGFAMIIPRYYGLTITYSTPMNQFDWSVSRAVYVCLSWAKMRTQNYVAKHAHAQSKFEAVKTEPVSFITTTTLEQL